MTIVRPLPNVSACDCVCVCVFGWKCCGEQHADVFVLQHTTECFFLLLCLVSPSISIKSVSGSWRWYRSLKVYEKSSFFSKYSISRFNQLLDFEYCRQSKKQTIVNPKLRRWFVTFLCKFDRLVVSQVCLGFCCYVSKIESWSQLPPATCVVGVGYLRASNHTKTSRSKFLLSKPTKVLLNIVKKKSIPICDEEKFQPPSRKNLPVLSGKRGLLCVCLFDSTGHYGEGSIGEEEPVPILRNTTQQAWVQQCLCEENSGVYVFPLSFWVCVCVLSRLLVRGENWRGLLRLR